MIRIYVQTIFLLISLGSGAVAATITATPTLGSNSSIGAGDWSVDFDDLDGNGKLSLGEITKFSGVNFLSLGLYEELFAFSDLGGTAIPTDDRLALVGQSENDSVLIFVVDSSTNSFVAISDTAWSYTSTSIPQVALPSMLPAIAFCLSVGFAFRRRKREI